MTPPHLRPTQPPQPTPPPEVPPAADQPAQAALGPTLPAAATPQPTGLRSRLAFFKFSHSHTASSAAMLLGFFILVSRVIGLVRDKYIAYTFGAGAATDAYNIAFNLPDLVYYFLVGGAASISFITILSRYREQGRDEDGEVALSVILNTIALVLGAALLLAEFLAPLYIRIYSKHNAAQDALAVHMTRILLPGQLFFFAGGVLASVALVRKQFTYQAISPLIYTLCIIAGGVLGAHWLGISSLAWGALAGTFCGPFLVNAYAAHRAGVRYRPVLDFHNEGLRDWVKMSVPLMLGVTVVAMDTQILQFFAKHATGDISRLMYAKKLFTAPMAIIGQAAGAASLPFFATLYSSERHEDFRNSVNRSVTRIVSVALLLTGAMFALARPLCDLVLRGGSFSRHDSIETALFVSIFSLSLALWSSQAIYIRAFFAAGQTLPPMLAGTVVTLISLPIYWGFYSRFGVIGLAWASNLAILLHTATLAVLLHTRYLVPLWGTAASEIAFSGPASSGAVASHAAVSGPAASTSAVSGRAASGGTASERAVMGPDRTEIGRSLLAAVLSAVAVLLLVHLLPLGSGYVADIILLIAGTAVWAAVGFATLRLTGSRLPTQLLRRRSA